MCLSLFPHQIQSYIELILHHWSRASKSYGLRLYRAGKLLDHYSHDVSSFLSHPLDMHRPVYGIALNSAKLAYHLKGTQYLANFGRGTCLWWFPHCFPVFLMTKCSGLSFSEGFVLRYVISSNRISETASVSGSELPISNLRPCTVSMRQWLACFDQGSLFFHAGHNFHCPEVISSACYS